MVSCYMPGPAPRVGRDDTQKLHGLCPRTAWSLVMETAAKGLRHFEYKALKLSSAHSAVLKHRKVLPPIPMRPVRINSVIPVVYIYLGTCQAKIQARAVLLPHPKVVHVTWEVGRMVGVCPKCWFPRDTFWNTGIREHFSCSTWSLLRFHWDLHIFFENPNTT